MPDITLRSKTDATRLPGRGLVIIVLCVALLFGALLRLDGIRVKRTLEYDEGITYLAAAGHQQAYRVASAGGLSGRWTSAGSWQALMRPDRFWDFRAISTGLAATDNHPPLYFWMLHIWVWIIGLHLWTGPLLNTLIAVFTGLAVFLLGRRALGDELHAALAVALWTASRPVVMTSMMARQYELLALCAVLLAWLAHRLASKDVEVTWADGAALACTLAAGALTHYEFILFAAGVLLLTLLSIRRQRPRLRLLLVAVATAAVLFVAGHPGFYHSLQRQRGQATHLTLAAVAHRLEASAAAVQSFFGLARAVDLTQGFAASARQGRPGLAVAIVALVAVVVLVATWPSGRKATWNYVKTRPAGQKLFAGLFLIALLTVVVPYVSGQVPPFAMGTRYMALVWPFVAIATVAVIGLLAGRRRTVTIVICLGLCLFQGAATLRVHTIDSRRATRAVERAQAVVIGVTQRGYLPRIVWAIPPDTPVYADSDDRLLENPAWVQRLSPGDLVVIAPPRKTAGTSTTPFVSLHVSADGPHSGWWGAGRFAYYTIEP
jgi:4-amino-4-deoxy-L-arabinose transferase-like glycosyltransferase